MKKTQQTPRRELETARRRMKDVRHESGRQRAVEAVQQRAVVQQGEATATLSVPGDLAAVEREVGAATWRLGDLVECDFSVAVGASIGAGEEIGSNEGLKALIPIFSAGEGVFVDEGPELRRDITLAERDPLGEGRSYPLRGVPSDESVDVDGYAALLDATIDLMKRSQPRRDEPTNGPEEC